jgi:hypothetical protein
MSAFEAVEQIAKEQGMTPEEVMDTLIRELIAARDLVQHFSSLAETP